MPNDGNKVIQIIDRYPAAKPEERQSQLKQLIALGKEQTYLTYSQINDFLPAEIVDPEQIEEIVNTINDMGIPVYEKAPQPLREDALLTSPLEPTNEGYALAKIAGLKLCAYYRRQYGRDFISAMPTNLYGPNDNFDLEHSHVLPALMRKFHDAKVAQSPTVTLWGTGSPRREFLHADDFAEACAALMDHYSSDQLINVGVGEDVSIRELAELMRNTVGYSGEIVWDTTMPDGTPRKLLDVTRINAGKTWECSKSKLSFGP